MVTENTRLIIGATEYPSLLEDGIVLADGFEAAFLGVAMRYGMDLPVATYDLERCIRILEERDGMSRPAAIEFFEYNVAGAWVGDQTPIYITGMSLSDVYEQTGEHTV